MDDGAAGDDAASVLPPALRLVWGRHERPRRGPKPGLTLDVIVRAAIELADAEGLAAVSMGRVAASLGFTTMSLYRYVSSKDELLALMNDAAAGPPPPPRRDDESWREALARWTREQMLVLRRHPWILHIPITSPPLLPNQLRWMDNGLRALAGTALTEGDKVGVIGMLTSYVMSEARIATEIGQAMAGADSGEAQFPGYPALLGQLLDADQYPALHAAVTAGVFDGSLGYEAEDLDFGLARMLDGVELLLTRRAQSDGTNVPSDWGQH